MPLPNIFIPDGYSDGETYCYAPLGSEGNTIWEKGGKEHAVSMYARYLLNVAGSQGIPSYCTNLSLLPYVLIGTRHWSGTWKRWVIDATDEVNARSYAKGGYSSADDEAAIALDVTPANSICLGPFPEDLCNAPYAPIDLKVLSCKGVTFTRLSTDTGGYPPSALPGDVSVYPIDYEAAKIGAIQGPWLERPNAGTTGRYYFGTDNSVLYRDNGTTWDVCPNDGQAAATGEDGHQNNVNEPGIVYPDDCFVFLFRNPAGNPPMFTDAPGSISDLRLIFNDAQNPPSYGFVTNNRLSAPYSYNTVNADGSINHIVTPYALYDYYEHTPGASGPADTTNYYAPVLDFADVYPTNNFDNNGNPIFYVAGTTLTLNAPWVQEGAGYDLMCVLSLYPDAGTNYLGFFDSPERSAGYIAASTAVAFDGGHTLRVRTGYDDQVDGRVYTDDWLITGPVSGTPTPVSDTTEPGEVRNLRVTDVSTPRTVTTIGHDAVGFSIATGEVTYSHAINIQWDNPTNGAADRYRVFIAEDRPAGIARLYDLYTLDGNEFYVYTNQTVSDELVNVTVYTTGNDAYIYAPGGTTFYVFVRGENGQPTGEVTPGEAAKVSYTLENYGPEDPTIAYTANAPVQFAGESDL